MLIMAKFLILIFAISLPFIGTADPNDLIDFDNPSNEKYFKSHTIISAHLDQDFNFKEDKAPTVYCLNDVVSNFSHHKINKFFLKIKYENWVYDWMKENKELRLFFNIDHNTGIPRLMGYSSKNTGVIMSSEADNLPAIQLKDFTHVNTASLEEGKYIVGTLSPDFNKVYPYVFKSAIVLGYPNDLKWGNIDSYVGSYRLNRPMSVALIQAILAKKADQLVLKKVGNSYEVAGFLRKSHDEMSVE